MKAGVIGVPDGDFGTVESFERKVSDDPELYQCVEVQRRQETENGLIVQKGRAATQKLDEQESVAIVDGSIRIQNRSQPVTKYTEFVAVPGQFVVVANSGGIFAFDLLADGVGIERAEIDLDGYLDVQQSEYDATPWKTGFYGHLGTAEKGVVYGEGVLDDEDFGGAVAGSQKNQLGLSYTQGDELMKVNITESGYVEIYQPSNYEEEEFSEFVAEEILAHAST